LNCFGSPKCAIGNNEWNNQTMRLKIGFKAFGQMDAAFVFSYGRIKVGGKKWEFLIHSCRISLRT
jgi:hypothetical protein